ncbi:polycystic kidney disease protein 1-like 3 isoform X19 [Drosophila sechellia]|uniref:polycystic kidney disease protein 1-like 3 isoform X19 n=1 Tax=Drosophila sechellia TaxID=7238 RepID=UPI0013DDEC5A|nr:polycystic kidney disease protein 1-like 3 isoform X19 [Drosophila sechellia]
MLLLQRRQSEKMFEAYIRKRFKANSAPFDISATSAFKPTKPLDIRLTHAPHPPLISPITGQPLSHVPAPLLLSSSTNSGAGSSFRLARSSTQPLQSPRVVHLAGQATGGSALARQNSVNDSINLSEQLTLSIGTDSEHIFEMSALEEDSAIQSLSDETAASASANSTSATTATTMTPPSGLTRSNSVRARANMFQQLQEQSRNQRATGSSTTRQSPPASSAEVSSSAAGNSMQSDEQSTPNATIDAEFEPSSLSLAERLAFFSNLCESGGGGGSASAGGRYRSRTSSYSRSPPGDRTTPRSSTSASSVSVTPTPMDYSPIPYDKEPSSLTLESIIEPEHEEVKEQVVQDEVKLRKKEAVQRESPQHNGFHVLTRSATDPPPSTSPLRISIRTVGKLVLPDTFRGDRNNNSSSRSGSTSWSNSCMVKLQSLEPVSLSVHSRTIGKVKSPFIEKQQEKPHTEKLANGTSDSGSDSGKENCASNEQEHLQHQQSQDEDRAPPRVSEMRRKISRLVQQQQPQPQPVNRRHTTEITSVTVGMRSPNVDDRFAKYFGVKETCNSTTTLHKTQSLPPSQVEAKNAHVKLPQITTVVSKRRELLKRTRPLSMDHYSSGCTSPTAMPSPKRAHSPVCRRKAAISTIEDIEVTPDELRAAGRNFKLLYGELLG